jgi:hypothetical protein
MDNLSFNGRGNLAPEEVNLLSAEEFEIFFVDKFQASQTRKCLFEALLDFIDNIKSIFDDSLTITAWLDGSFVTNKMSPNDLDVVIFLPNELVELNESELLNVIDKYKNANCQIDSYILKVYPQDHSRFIRTQSDTAYWTHWFGSSKPNRQRKRLKKGFIELKFE